MSLLLSKFTIGGQEVGNRVVLAPLTRARCEGNNDDLYHVSNNCPNELHAEYYSQRADNNLLISEATQISEAGSGWPNAPSIYKQEHVDAWKPVVEKVHEQKAIFYCQLWHIGRQSHSSFHPSTPGKIFCASAIKVGSGNAKTTTRENVDYEVPVEMTKDEIKQTIQDFVQAARNAKKAGFDGVELHSAGGYLIDTFFQSCSNQRTDEYGGSIENRFRFMKEIVEALIADGAYPSNRIGFRLSPNGTYASMGSDDNFEAFLYFAKELNKYNLAYCHVMDGFDFTGYHEKCKPVTASDIRKVYSGPIMVNVGLTKEIAEGMIRSGAADMAAFGRIYMSNPDLVKRFQNDSPLNELPPYETWWQPTGAKGYTDWPTYESTKKKKQFLIAGGVLLSVGTIVGAMWRRSK